MCTGVRAKQVSRRCGRAKEIEVKTAALDCCTDSLTMTTCAQCLLTSQTPASFTPLPQPKNGAFSSCSMVDNRLTAALTP